MSDHGFRFIGEPELLTGFRFAGVPGQATFNRSETLAAFHQAIADQVKVLILSREVAGLIHDELVAWELGGRYPLVVELPPLEGEAAAGKSLLDLIREAIGIRV